jgi:hypothetical protein
MIVPLIASILGSASVLSSLPSRSEVDREQARARLKKLLQRHMLGRASSDYIVSAMIGAWPAVRAPWARFIATQWMERLKKKNRKENEESKRIAQSRYYRGSGYRPHTSVYLSISPLVGNADLGIRLNEGGFDMTVRITLAHEHSVEVDVGFDTKPDQVVFDADGLHLDPELREPFARAIAKALDAAVNLDAWDRWRPSRDQARAVLLDTEGRSNFMWYYKMLEPRSEGWSLVELVQEPVVRDHFLQLIGVEFDQWERATSTWHRDMSSSPAWMLPL